jgi:hypothetical protein
MLRDNEGFFGRLAGARAPQLRNTASLVVEYPMLSDGNACHHQDSGWIKVVDITWRS